MKAPKRVKQLHLFVLLCPFAYYKIMKISGFTIACNVIKYNYPVLESIRSILPICDEFIINVGKSEDETLALMQSLDDPKIRIIQTDWDFSMGKEVLSFQTNVALKECTGDWAFYLQTDEVIHERDLPRLKKVMQANVDDPHIDALRFQWFHFYGSYYRYRIDKGWYQKQDRIIRNNGQVVSFGDAYSFQRKDGRPLRRQNTRCFIYHYGWVQDEKTMKERRLNAEKIGFVTLKDKERENTFEYGELNRFPVYFGPHPQVMTDRVHSHSLSKEDALNIKRKFWWNPVYWLKIRYKTGRRVKEKIE